MSNTLRDKLADIVQEAMWSPASGSVVWTPEKIAKAQEQSGYVADAVLKAIADSGCVIVPKLEMDDLKSSLITFCAVHATRYAKELGLPHDHLHPTHYDILERAGARMDYFTRAMISASQEAQG